MSEKIYRVQMNSKGMPNFSTAVEIEDIPIYGNEHNCMMTIFGECSYAETGCGDCAVVEKVRKALSADRPQGEWIYGEHDVAMCDGYRCDRCGFFVPWDYEHKFIDFINDYNFCPSCGSKMKGADDE